MKIRVHTILRERLVTKFGQICSAVLPYCSYVGIYKSKSASVITNL